MNTISLLRSFVEQRPNLCFSNYGDVKYYRQDYREILKDLHSFRELLYICTSRIDDFEDKLKRELENSSGRLKLENGKLEYCTGQYFPTEYRAAACRVLANLLWTDYRDEKNVDGTPVYADGHAMRKAIKRRLSSRNTKLYFR